MSEFSKAQSNQERAMIHTSKSELKELSAAQSQRARAWRENERKQRKAFFDAHTAGPERREYVQNYLKRKKELDDAQKGDYEDAKKRWAEKIDAMKKRQKEQAAAFKASVEQGVRPGSDMWPN